MCYRDPYYREVTRRRMAMKTLVGAGVFGLVPDPTMLTYMRNHVQRSTTTGDTSPFIRLPDDINEGMATRDEVRRIRPKFLTRLRVPS